MAKFKYDVVIEAVHYTRDGKVEWVRGYERRGPTFSDYRLFQRSELVSLLKAGKRFIAGRRVEKLASTFEVTQPLRLVQSGDNEVLATGQQQPRRDLLDGVPIL